MKTNENVKNLESEGGRFKRIKVIGDSLRFIDITEALFQNQINAKVMDFCSQFTEGARMVFCRTVLTSLTSRFLVLRLRSCFSPKNGTGCFIWQFRYSWSAISDACSHAMNKWPRFQNTKLLSPGHTERDAIRVADALRARSIVAPGHFNGGDYTKRANSQTHMRLRSCFGKCKNNRGRNFGVARALGQPLQHRRENSRAKFLKVDV